MSRPVARAGVAAAAVSALTALCVLAVPAFLPSWHVAWLINPLIGVEVRPLRAEYLGLPTGTDLAVSLAIAGIGTLAVAFYLDHCVVDQPMWAVVGGWGFLLSGLVMSTLQEAVNASRAALIDIDHLLWPFGLVALVLGATVVLVSWWRAPESFSPHLSRWTLLAVVPAMAIIALAELGGVPQVAILALAALIVTTAMTAGEWIAGRSGAGVRRRVRPSLSSIAPTESAHNTKR